MSFQTFFKETQLTLKNENTETEKLHELAVNLTNGSVEGMSAAETGPSETDCRQTETGKARPSEGLLRASEGGSMTLPRMRVVQLRIQSPGCRKPNPGTAGPHFLWLNTPTGEPRGNGSSVCSLVLAARPKLFPVRAGGSELQRQEADRSRPKALSRAKRLPAPFRQIEDSSCSVLLHAKVLPPPRAPPWW